MSFRILLALLSGLLMATAAAAQVPATVPGYNFDRTTGTITNQRWEHGVPLGGIGVGKIEVLTDGAFGNFANNNNWDVPFGTTGRTRVNPDAGDADGYARGAFAAVCAQSGKAAPVARMLRSAQADEYSGVTNPQTITMQGWFPRAEVHFSDVSLPVGVHLRAFSPLVAHDIKDSSLPVACLAYTLTNSGTQPVKASVLLAWPNLLGFGGLASSQHQARWADATGNTQSPFTAGSLQGLRYTTTQHYGGQQRDNAIGEYVVAVHAGPGLTISSCPNWDAAASAPAFWPQFSAGKALAALRMTAKQPAGAVAAQMRLAPGQSKTVTFYVVWHMPHLITQDSSQTQFIDQGHRSGNVQERWTTGHSQTPQDSLVIDLGRKMTPMELRFDQGASAGDYPRGLDVQTSTDQQTWTTVAARTSSQIAASLQDGKFTVLLKPSTGRYLRLNNQGGIEGTWWSFHALRVTSLGQTAPLTLVPAQVSSKPIDRGHYYSNFFHNAVEITSYVDKQQTALRRQTEAWQTPLQKSNLPFWLRLKLINDAFVMVNNTILTKDGTFSVQEAPTNMGAQLGTMDQRMAAHAFCADFFPELDQAELELFAAQQQPDGSIPHCNGNVADGIGTPYTAYGLAGWADLCCSWVMQTVKMYRWTGDKSYLLRMQPRIIKAMAYLAGAHKGTDPIPQGGSTYDYTALPGNGEGAFSYTASCYLGALEAAAAASRDAGDMGHAREYDAQRVVVQKAVMQELWNGKFLRKYYSALHGGAEVENSFVAALAGDWLARLTGLPRTMDADILHQEDNQLITRHLTAFRPVPPMEVTPDGGRVTGFNFFQQDQPYLGCESIYENNVDDGLDVLHRVYQASWLTTQNPWWQGLDYASPRANSGGYFSYMTSPASWHVLNALSGLSVDVPNGILFVSPRLPSSLTELHLPVYFPRFWGRLDYVPAAKTLTLTITQVFSPNLRVAATVYHASGPNTIFKETIVLDYVALDGDAALVRLPHPFPITQGATLDLSGSLQQLTVGPGTPLSSARVSPLGQTITLKTLAEGKPIGIARGTLTAAVSSSTAFKIIDLGDDFVALQSASDGRYVSAPSTAGPLTLSGSTLGPSETFLLLQDGPGKLGLQGGTFGNRILAVDPKDNTLTLSQSGFPEGATAEDIQKNENSSRAIFLWTPVL